MLERAETPSGLGPAERRIRRQFAVFIGAGYLIYLILMPLGIFETGLAPWPWTVVAAAAIFGPGLAQAVAGISGDVPAINRLTRVCAVSYVVILLTFPPAWNGATTTLALSMWFIRFAALPAMSLGAIVRLRWSMTYLVVVSVAARATNALV